MTTTFSSHKLGGAKLSISSYNKMFFKCISMFPIKQEIAFFTDWSSVYSISYFDSLIKRFTYVPSFIAYMLLYQ